MKDMKNNQDVVSSIVPAVYKTNQNGTGADLKEFDGAMLVFHGGALTDGTHTPAGKESNDNAAWNVIDSDDLEGALVDMVANSVQRVGYKGSKRYIRAQMDSSGSTGMSYSATVVRGFPHRAPVE